MYLSKTQQAPMTDPSLFSAKPQTSTVWWKVACLFTAIGLIWRIGRYLFDFPIWGDEIMVALNFPDKSLKGKN